MTDAASITRTSADWAEWCEAEQAGADLIAALEAVAGRALDPHENMRAVLAEISAKRKP